MNKLALVSRIRLLPVVIAIAILTFGLKVGDLWNHSPFVLGGAKPAEAQQAANEAEPAEKAAGDDANVNADGEESAAAPAPEKQGDEDDAAPLPDASDFTQAELEMLQRLATRREQLKSRARELDLRENLLKAAEEQIEKKIIELKKIEATITDLLKKHDDEQESKLRRIVKVYENMKPKQAAPIFNQLDMELLLDVVERMREVKIAPILALMETEKARDMSTQLAMRRKLPISGNNIPQFAPAGTETN